MAKNLDKHGWLDIGTSKMRGEDFRLHAIVEEVKTQEVITILFSQ